MKRNQAALDKIQVVSGLWATIECALDTLKYPHISNKVKRVAHSLLENLRDFKNRALAAIGIGCDQYPGGIKGIGPGAVSMVVSEAMEKSVTDFKDVLLAFSTKKECRLSKEALLALNSAFVFKPPCNILKKDGETMPDNFEYFDSEPLQVPEYLKCFVTDPRKVTSGPALALCIGTKATREHVFLAKDGESKCLDCAFWHLMSSLLNHL